MPSAAILPTITALVGTGLQVYNTVQTHKATKAKKKAVTVSNERKKKVQAQENEQRLSLAKARAAASGSSGVSEDLYLMELQNAGIEELEWLTTTGGLEAESAEISGTQAQIESFEGLAGSIIPLSSASQGWLN